MTAEPLGDLSLRRLLVAVDGSANAELALQAAVTAARRDHAALTLISVAHNVAAEAGRWPGAVMPAGLQADADAQAQRILAKALERIGDELPATTIFRCGRPGPEIIRAASEADYDAILLGARGVGRVGALMGNVSQYVLHHAETAVFVAHAPRAAAAP